MGEAFYMHYNEFMPTFTWV